MRNKTLLIVSSLVVASLLAPGVTAQTGGSQRVIDDFTINEPKQQLVNGSRTARQAGLQSHIVGGVRETFFIAAPLNSFNRSSVLEVRRRALFVECGLKSSFGLYLIYGNDLAGNPNPLNLALIHDGYDHFRVTFDSCDASLNYVFEVWDGSGNSAVIDTTVETAGRNEPFSIDFPFTDFTPNPGTAIDWDDIDSIIVLFQTGNAIGANDFALTSIVALPPGA
jgi:hypothetical protein